MNGNHYFVTGRCLTDDKYLYATNYYLGDLIEVDLQNNCIKTIALEEEGVYLIYTVYFDGKRIVMYPRNSRKIYIIDRETYQKQTIELRKEISDYTFPVFYDNKIVVFERREKGIWLIDYSANMTEYVMEYQEEYNFSNVMVYKEIVLLLSPENNSLFLYSLDTGKGNTILFSERIEGITKMYIFQEYFVGFNLKDSCITFFDRNGKRQMNYMVKFEKVQIEPYMYSKGKDILCFLSNTDGIAYEINIKDGVIEKKEISILKNKSVYYFKETERNIYGIKMTESYDEVLEEVYEIEKVSLDIKVYSLEFFDNEDEREYKTIKEYINDRRVIIENAAINIKQFVKCI